LRAFGLRKLATLCELFSSAAKHGTIISENFIEAITVLLANEGEAGLRIAAGVREKLAHLPLTVDY
jgi:hypothetical protein